MTDDSTIDQLAVIRDKMCDLADMRKPECRDIVMGLLLTVQHLARLHGGEAERIACQIHATTQEGWIKAHKRCAARARREEQK